MKKFSLGVLIIACSVVLALGQAVKHEASVTVQAKTQVVTGTTLHLGGEVQITYDQHIIRADEVDFNVTTGDIEARGNVQAVKIGLLAIEDAQKALTLRTNIDGKSATFTLRRVLSR